MLNVGRREIPMTIANDHDVRCSGGRQAISVKPGDGVRIRRIASQRGWTARKCIEDEIPIRAWIRRGLKAVIRVKAIGRIIRQVRCDRDFVLVEVQAITAAHNKSVMEITRSPVEPNLRPEIPLGRLPKVVAGRDRQSSKGRSTLSKHHARNIVLLRIQRSKEGVAKTCGQRECRKDLPTVLNKRTKEVLAVIGTRPGE